ncbi:MAG: transglutaminase domain-containing protein, partial [Oscillospiraceae bacterium]
MKKQHKQRILSIVLICTLLSYATVSVASAEQVSLQTVQLSAPIYNANRPVQTTVLTPVASGKAVKSGSGATIDYSNCNEGYVMVKYTGSCSKVKLQITGSNKVTYTYVLKPHDYQTFPLTSGDGNYTVNVFENVSGNQYALALGHTVSVKLKSSLLPYLYPNQYVDFNAQSATVAKGAELAANAADEIAVVTNVYNYVTSNITYDQQKALSVTSGYLPVVDTILA